MTLSFFSIAVTCFSWSPFICRKHT